KRLSCQTLGLTKMKARSPQSSFLIAHTTPLVALVVACAPAADEPMTVMVNGKISEVRGCSPPKENNRTSCLRALCEKALYDRAILPPYAQISKSQSVVNRSVQPQRTEHTLKFQHNGQARFAKCEMDDLVVFTAQE